VRKIRRHDRCKAAKAAASHSDFRLPPDVSYEKRRLSYGWEYMFRHRRLGELGRIVIEDGDGAYTHIAREVAGDPADPMTATRRRIFEPLTLEISQRMEAATGPAPPDLPPLAMPRPSEPAEMIESKLMPYERCNAFVAMVIYAPNATDPGRFEDYARRMYPEYASRNLPTWIVGPTQGDGPLIDRPADILKIWPDREPMRRLRPKEFNPLIDELLARHCHRGPMPDLTVEQQQLAWKIHATVQDLAEKGADDMTIFGEMTDLMPDFRRLPDSTSGDRGVIAELCSRNAGFCRYAKILENVVGKIGSGEMRVPR
jgi:hypothetical protein